MREAGLGRTQYGPDESREHQDEPGVVRGRGRRDIADGEPSRQGRGAHVPANELHPRVAALVVDGAVKRDAGSRLSKRFGRRNERVAREERGERDEEEIERLD